MAEKVLLHIWAYMAHEESFLEVGTVSTRPPQLDHGRGPCGVSYPSILSIGIEQLGNKF